MQGAMLQNEGGAVNADDLPAGIGFPDDHERVGVTGVIIDRDQHGAIQNEEVGIGDGEPMLLLIVLRRRPGQGDEVVGGAGKGSQAA